jgi:alpha-L-fucosidase 2
MKSYKCILIGALLCCSVALGQNWDQWKLQYSQPATQWTEALPVGNGHMGACIAVKAGPDSTVTYGKY